MTAPESDETTPRLTQRQTTKFNSTQKIWLRTYDCAVSSQYRCFEFAPIGPFSALTGPFKLLNHCIRKYFKFAAVGLFRAERVRVYMYLSVCIVWSLWSHYGWDEWSWQCQRRRRKWRSPRWSHKPPPRAALLGYTLERKKRVKWRKE